jgi:phosphoenolpyruvate-protein phosphotransferase (PTS system enzyme I)
MTGQWAPTGGRILRGLGVSQGVAIGKAHVVESGAVDTPEYCLPADAVESEVLRLRDAVSKARRQIGKLEEKARQLPGAAAEEMGYLLDAHRAMLTNSRLTRGVEKRIQAERINAEAAVQTEIALITRSFAEMDDAYIASRAADVREVGQRLIRNLMQHQYRGFSRLTPGAILLAEEITPADAALIDPKQVAGFAAVLGGAEGHTAIMARSLGLPAVLGAPGLLHEARNGMTVIIDGADGRIILDPDEATLADYRVRLAEQKRRREALKALSGLSADTLDGLSVTLLANVELPRDSAQALAYDARGVGLLRTEFMFMNREELPSEDEQYQILRELVLAMKGLPVTARTFDLGGEKLVGWMAGRYGEPANPALGLRAVRLSLKEPRLMDEQLAAMLRAAVHGPMRILVPMVSSIDEIRAVRTAISRVQRRLLRRGVAFADPAPPLGAMIEIPGAALAADSLAQVCDFFAIGTNDLTQYTLAIDRADDQVAHLYDPLHPAVLRLIHFTVGAARRAGIPVSVCGEIAGDPRLTPLLLGLGVRELSMSPPNLPLVKERVRGMRLDQAVVMAERVMNQWERKRVSELLDGFGAGDAEE